MTDESRIAALEQQVSDLVRRTTGGYGATSLSGAGEVRQVQTGAPATITAVFNATPGKTAGYGWSKNLLDVNSPGMVADPIPETGFNAYTADNNTGLAIGQQGWLVVDRQATGYWFLIAGAGAKPFPAQLTSTFSSKSGYSWRLLSLQTAGATYQLSSPAVTGIQAVDVGNNEQLQPGRNAVFFADPTNPGWYLFHLWPLPLVAQVCDTIVSGRVTSITVASYIDDAGDVSCAANPSNCGPTGLCPPATICSICPSTTLPNQLFATFSGFTGWASIYNGTWPLAAVYYSSAATTTWTFCFQLGDPTSGSVTPCTVTTNSYQINFGCNGSAGAPYYGVAFTVTPSIGFGAWTTVVGNVAMNSCQPFNITLQNVQFGPSGGGFLSNAGTVVISANADTKAPKDADDPDAPDPAPPTPPCKFKLGMVARPATATVGQWVKCGNPLLPLKTPEDPTGNAVCSCRGCGPSCSGYTLPGPPALPDAVPSPPA